MTKQIISNEVCCQPNCNFMLATVETHFIISDALRFMFSRLISQQDKVAFCNSADILPTYPLTHHTYQHTPQSLVSTHFGTYLSVTFSIANLPAQRT